MQREVEQQDRKGADWGRRQKTTEHLIAKLYAVSKALQHNGWSPKFLAQLVLDAAIDLSGAECGSLVMVHKGQPLPSQAFFVKMDEARRQAIEAILIGRGLLGKLDQGHHVLRLKDLALKSFGCGDPLVHPSPYAFCGTAMKVHDGLFGRLYLLKRQGAAGEFSEPDEQAIGTLAVLAGLAIHTAFLVDKVMTARSQHIALLESTAEGIYGVDLEGRCTFINKAGASLLGYQPEDLIGRRIHELTHHARRDKSSSSSEVCALYQAYRTGQAYRMDDDVLWNREGKGFPAEISSSPLYEGGILTGAVITFRDITERKRAEVMRTHLLDRLMRAQEEERQRIARELHDDTEQALASLLIGLRNLEELPTLDTVREHASKLRQVSAQTLDELQRLVQGLRPALLDEMGLAAALRHLCTDVAQAHGIRVELHVGQLAGLRMAPSVETALYRIVQEALTNIAKHAHAKTASVLIQPTASSVRLVVEDDGCGFDPEAVRRTAARNGCLGLYGMQERVKLFGGVFTVESADEQGTTIHVEMPLSPGAAS